VIDEPMPTAPVDESVEPEVVELSREAMLGELLSFSNSFISNSAAWRRSSFENDWIRWSRNSDSIYDPAIAAKKEPWQSKAFWPITASHRENAQAQLFKTEVGPNPALKFKPLVDVPPEFDQSENLKDLILRERAKSNYEIERNSVLDDKTTYGSGFARMRFETVTEDRVQKVPDLEPMNILDPGSIMRHMSGQAQVVGYHDEVKEVITYRGVRFEHISIWDFFPDPKSLKIKGSTCAYRYETTWGEVLDGIEAGYYLPEAMKLKDVASDETIPSDKQQQAADRKISESTISRPNRGKLLRCYELFARLPQKWVLINGQPITDPEKLIPAIVRFHAEAVVSVELNDAYDGEPQIFKDDYMPVAGRFYGRGIPEMGKDAQLVANETINQRLDTGSIALSQKFAIVEKAIHDPKDIDENRNVIRLKNPSGFNDIRQLMMKLDMGSVNRDAFIEPQEWERILQERTSITSATMSGAHAQTDNNNTLGALEMQRGVTGDKMAYLGMLSEFDFQRQVTMAYWRLIYQNYGPEDYAIALGPQRAATFIPMTPEEVANSYQYIPQGIFSMENKALRQGRLAQIDSQFGAAPWFNRVEIARAELTAAEEDPSQFIIPEAEAVQIMEKAAMMAQGMAQQQAEQGKPAQDQPKDAPGGR